MQYLINRIKHEFTAEISAGDLLVAIVTGNEPLNTLLAERMVGVPVFYGDPHNIPRQHLETAKQLSISYIVSVDGDDVLCSPSAMRDVFTHLRSEEDFVRVEGLPLGMNVWGYSTQCLERCLAKSTAKILETGWGRIFSNETPVLLKRDSRSAPHLRLTLDYPEDLCFFHTLLDRLGHRYISITDKDLVNFVLDNNLHRITMPIAEEYWVSFNKLRDAEMRGETK